MARKNTTVQSNNNGNNDAVLENVAATLSTALEQVTRLARGTQDVAPVVAAMRAASSAAPANDARTPAPVVAPAASPPPPLPERVAAALREASMDVPEIARVLGEPAGRVSNVIRDLRRAQKVSNVGTEDHPLWTWRPGDAVSSKDLIALVRRLLSERPMTTRELTDATGARYTRVGGAVVAIQREPGEGCQVLDLDPVKHAGRWFLITDRARDARLSPKRRRG